LLDFAVPVPSAGERLLLERDRSRYVLPKPVSVMGNPWAVHGVRNVMVAGLDDIGRHGADKGAERLRTDRWRS
jgi:hypothetical protein